MFEKEAEERARKLEVEQILCIHNRIYDNEEDYERDRSRSDGEVAGYKKGFKDGAEFGYNKANEWHYVKDGDLPTKERNYIVKLTDGTIDIMAIALDGNLEPYLLTPKLNFYKDVEKWCEIPKEN